MKCYKGFFEDLTCRGFQYEVGKTYKTDKAELCKCGFHACKKMEDVIDYYYPWNYYWARYCEVELGGTIVEGKDKACATEITIIRKLSAGEVAELCGGIARVREGDTWNFINKDGRLVSDTWFDSAGRFCDGFSLVEGEDGWNYIGKDGKFLSDVWFQDAEDFCEGFACVKWRGEYNFLDKDGKYLSDKWYDCAWCFIEGRACVKLRGENFYIDKEGKRI